MWRTPSKETGSSNYVDASLSNSKIKTRRKETANENSRTRPTRTKVDEENGLTSRTRSVKRENTSSPKKSERRKSGVHSIQTASPSRSLQNSPTNTRKNKNAIQSKSSEKSKSKPQKNSLSLQDSMDKMLPQKKEVRRKVKQMPKELDSRKGSEQRTSPNSDTEVIQLSSASNTTTSLVSASEHEDSLSDDMMTLPQEQGRRLSGRVRKLTHKAAAAQDTNRVQSKQSSPRKKGSNLPEILDAPAKNTDSIAVNGHASICVPISSTSTITKWDSSSNHFPDAKKLDEATDVLCNPITSCASSTNICTDVQEVDKATNVSSAKKLEFISSTDNHSNTQELDVGTNGSSDKTKTITLGTDSHPERNMSDSSPYIVVSQVEKNIQIHTITPVSFSQKRGHGHRKDDLSSNKINTTIHKFAQEDTKISKSLTTISKSLPGGDDKTCPKSPSNRTKGATGSPNQDLTLQAGREEIVAVRADAAVQVSLMENRHKMVNSWTQVESEQGTSVDLLQSGSSSKTPVVDLNAMLTMQESDEKVLGGVSALIKDSLMQISGMRHFVIHDLPVLTNVACFQTADKIAISGTIQGISRAWSILTNIEHTVHSKDPKSKKSVKIQWTGKNGVKKTVEFRKTPESQNASVTPTMSNKVVTVFVDIKSPEDEMNRNKEVELAPLREEGPSPLKHKYSSENIDNSTTTQNDSAPKKQISLLSGKSYSMSHIKMEGKIGVPVSKPNKEDIDGSNTGYTITVADDDVGPGDTVLAEYNFASTPIKPSTVEKDPSNPNISTVVRSGSKKSPSSDGDVGGTQGQNDESDDNCYDNEYGDPVIWEGKNVEKEMITVTQSGEFMCGQCLQVFSSRPDLISHQLQSHEKIDTPDSAPSFVECIKCSQRFRCRLELHRHERRSHSLVSLLPKTNPVSYTCNVCDKKFSEKRYLTTHLKRHTGIKRHCCPICGWRFFEAHKLKFHLETHKSEEDRQLPYRCTICQRQYHNRQSWNDHMNTHTGSKPYTCSICGTGFAHRIGLHRHKLTHEKECQHKCPYCSRGFKVKANLRAHLTIHTGIGKHSCPVCKKVFTVATSLRRHKCQPTETKEEELSEETGDGAYMFMCGVCNMTFSTLGEAETHSLTHVEDTSSDMSLVGVQVEEVGEESNVLTSDTNETSTTYIIESDNSVKTMVISSMQNPGDVEGFVDEVQKVQIAASTLADLSSMSTSAESSHPGKDIQTIYPVEDVSAMQIQTVTAGSLVTSENVSGKETQTHTASGSLTSEVLSGIDMHTVTADSSVLSVDVSSKETHTASASATLENVSGKQLDMVTMSVLQSSEQDLPTSEQDTSGLPEKEMQPSTASGVPTPEQDTSGLPEKEMQPSTASRVPTPEQDTSGLPEKEMQPSTASGVPTSTSTSEQGVSETSDESTNTDPAVCETSINKSDISKEFENTPEEQIHDGNAGNSVDTVSSTQQ